MRKTVVKIWRHDFFGSVLATGVLAIVAFLGYVITGKGFWVGILAGGWTLGMLYGRYATLAEIQRGVPPFMFGIREED